MPVLRDYQRQAIDDLRKRWDAGSTRVPMVLATGLGKGVIIGATADEWLADNPGRRVLVIAHTMELIDQLVQHVRNACPRRRVGVVMGGRNDVHAEIIVGSRQTLASAKRRGQVQRVGLIVIDECHFGTRHNTYGKILEHFGAFDEPSPVCVAGFTATLARSDKQKLSAVWQDCTFARDILFGIRNGYLLDVTAERIIVPELDMSRVRVTAGDYSDADLGEEMERSFAPEVIAGEYQRLAPGKQGIAFWPLVATSYAACEAFEAAGIPSAVLHGGLPKEERKLTLKKFWAGEYQVLHNAMVLTVGFDPPPGVDVVVIGRPTKSAVLYVQMVGRVLRPDLTVPPAERGKALILDVHGVGEQHSLRGLIDLSPERRRPAGVQDEAADGKSLLEWDEYLDEIEQELDGQRAGASFVVESDEYRGKVETKSFDPLGRDKVWQSTPGGSWFISAGGVAYVFLAPSINGDPGTYDVVMCSKNNYVRDGVTPWVKGTEHQGLPLDMALGWGEELAVQVGGIGTATLTARKASWRKASPTEAQKSLAYKLKIPGVKRRLASLADEVDAGTLFYETELTKGELSQAIDAAYATRRIDPIVAMVQRATAEGANA